MREHWHSLRYWLRHKWFVFIECRKLNVPLWIAMLHDWDKLLPDEWFAYVNMRISTGGTRDPQTIAAFRLAQMQHYRRNKHHWQYWVIISELGSDALPMPDVYRREMLADWRGAALSMGKPDLLGWYTECRDGFILHPETRAWLEGELGYEPL